MTLLKRLCPENVGKLSYSFTEKRSKDMLWSTSGPSGKIEEAQALCEEEEEQEEVKDMGRDSCAWCSSDEPPDAAALSLITGTGQGINRTTLFTHL